MGRLAAGEDAALNELMRRWQQPLTSFLLRYTGNEADALDLAQETFVRVYQSRHRYRAGAKFSTWLFTIASNLSRNLARWHQRHPTVCMHSSGVNDGASSLERTLASPEDTPADNAERDDLAGAVREHIQRLPHQLRTAVLLSEYQDLSHEEVARVLHCTPKAVETRLYRARQTLRESLARWRIA
jgi:RNA polymerase sigma-70 factor (ECF subfamily)